MVRSLTIEAHFSARSRSQHNLVAGMRISSSSCPSMVQVNAVVAKSRRDNTRSPVPEVFGFPFLSRNTYLILAFVRLYVFKNRLSTLSL